MNIKKAIYGCDPKIDKKCKVRSVRGHNNLKIKIENEIICEKLIK